MFERPEVQSPLLAWMFTNSFHFPWGARRLVLSADPDFRASLPLEISN